MLHTYNDRGLRRLGVRFIHSEKPRSPKAAALLLKNRLGAYVANTTLIKELVQQHYQDAPTS